MSILSFSTILTKELPRIEDKLEQVFNSLPPSIHEIVNVTSKAGGKRLRPLLAVLSAQFFTNKKFDSKEPIYTAACTLEMLHLASLLHDDVMDNADTRRGKATAHTKFGNTKTILAGDGLLAKASEMLTHYNSNKLMRVFANATLYTANGQIEELAYQGSLEHGIEKYKEIIRGKTAYLLRSSCLLGAVYMQDVHTDSQVTDAEVEALGQYGEEIGMAFQMIDDALDFAPMSQTGKPQGGDIREGKATLPILAYYHSLKASEKEIFAYKFSKAGTSEQFTEEEVSEISAKIIANSFDQVAHIEAKKHFDNAAKCLDIFENSKSKDIFLAAIDYLSQRKK